MTPHLPPPKDQRPKRFPPPEFPPRRPALFARTPPAIFPAILGLLGLTLALRLALAALGAPTDPAELLAGAAVALWAFAVLAYGAKLARRPAVVIEDLRVLPGRSGLAALTMGTMATAMIVLPYSSTAGAALLVAGLAGHLLFAALLIRVLIGLPAAGREVNPTWHLSFVGMIVAAPPALALGWDRLGLVLFWAALPVALVIWGLSLRQFLRLTPPAVLRPLLAIHMAPAALLATVAVQLGKADLAEVLVSLGAAYAFVLFVALRWMTEAGVTPLWGAFTFPLAALATAMLVMGSGWQWPGLALAGLGLVAIPAILWWVLKRWPGGKLAAVTNAAEA
jgi:tellurite resistance protein